MAEIKISNTDTYQGVYPTVFKKINSSDVSLTPFQSYKQWTFYSGSSTSSCLPLQGIYSDITSLPALDTELTYNDAKNIDNSLQTITYYSINRLFYKYKEHPYNTLGPTNLNRINKYLYQTASIFSIPYLKIGEGIKPTSLDIECYYGGANLLNIKSDRYGNLYDAAADTSSFVSGTKFYEGFNEYFDTTRIKYTSSGVKYVPGVTDLDIITAPVGLSANFSSSGYVKTELVGEYSRDTDYSISFFVSGSDFSAASSSPTKLLIAKISESTTQQYPFKIELASNPAIQFSVRGGTNYVQIKEGITTSDWAHIICQKTGSTIEVYVDSTLMQTVSAAFLTNSYNPLSVLSRIDNPDPLWIGGISDSTQSSVNGCLDEIRIFNRALSQTEINSLASRYLGDGTLLQTNVVGNVFSKQGIAVVSTPDYRFNGILQTAYTGSYRSTLTSYELGVVTKIDSGDFNLSLNSTLTMDNDITYHSFITSSTFTPYITTIGLYDDMGQLLAVGKLAQPVKKPANVDLNFLVRMDLNNNIIPR